MFWLNSHARASTREPSKFYGPTGDSKLIREVKLDFKEKDNITRKFEDMDFTINPTSAGENDSHTVVVTITEGS